MHLTTSVIVSFDFSDKEDHGVCIVGRQDRGEMRIINAFQGKEAREIFDKLTTKKGD